MHAAAYHKLFSTPISHCLKACRICAITQAQQQMPMQVDRKSVV
jgi:hypothetical protein